MTDRIKTGGPAFPGVRDVGYPGHYHGMTLRDYAAIHCDPKLEISDQTGADDVAKMFGLPPIDLTTTSITEILDFGIAAEAAARYRMADAMLKARENDQ